MTIHSHLIHLEAGTNGSFGLPEPPPSCGHTLKASSTVRDVLVEAKCWIVSVANFNSMLLQRSMPTAHDLPEDLWSKVFGHLNTLNLARNCALVSKDFNKLVQDALSETMMVGLLTLYLVCFSFALPPYSAAIN